MNQTLKYEFMIYKNYFKVIMRIISLAIIGTSGQSTLNLTFIISNDNNYQVLRTVKSNWDILFVTER
jgi:hypothetical protein